MLGRLLSALSAASLLAAVIPAQSHLQIDKASGARAAHHSSAAAALFAQGLLGFGRPGLTLTDAAKVAPLIPSLLASKLGGVGSLPAPFDLSTGGGSVTPSATCIPAVLGFDRDPAVYTAGESGCFIARGVPGSLVLVLWDTDPGPTFVPGVGLLHVGFSAHFYDELVVIPAAGFFECFQTSCPGTSASTVYGQGISMDPATLELCLSNAISATTLPCGDHCRSDVFPLGAAASYAVLALDGADLDIGSGSTLIDGDVGLGAHTTGSLMKATITGKLLRDPTSTAAQHPDLVVNGGTWVASLGSAVGDALAASSSFAALPPTQTFGDVTVQDFTITGAGGLNVIQIQSLSVVGGSLTFVGGPSDRFLINVLGDFTWNGGTMLVQGGVTMDRVLWNFPTAGNPVGIFKPVMVAIGTFLAPFRDVILDKGTLFGAIIGGRRVVVHSGAQLNCPTH